MHRTTVQTLTMRVAGALLAVAVGLVANWRLALLAALAALAIAVMRVRYSALCALIALAAVLGLAGAGASAGTDQRAAARARVVTTSRCADVVRAGHRVGVVRARRASCATARHVVRAWLAAGGRSAIVRDFRCRGQRHVRCRLAAARISGVRR